MAGIFVKFGVTPQEFLYHLTFAAYQVALKYGFKAAFTDVVIDLEAAMMEVMRKDMLVSEVCGSPYCQALNRDQLTPLSDEAKKLFMEDS